ncbi:DUF3955 domain-containing protein [Staphylococcus xylosus]|uniref:DUF3955 domain-containing protein n=2 Tax=Staphylococcus xylosus TaxID=1288 RepID=UPI0011C93349|nr:DUF3955 domain-containing protein [Staphylococcus xylosus]
MSKKFLIASVISMVIGIALGVLFLMIPSYVDENNILREPWILVEYGFLFLVIGIFMMIVSVTIYAINKFKNRN